MVRVPFGFNTKRHGRFTVHMAQTGGPTYIVTDLRTRYAVKPAAPTCEDDTAPPPASWANLPNGDALLNSPLPARAIECRPDLKLILVEGGRKVVSGGKNAWA